MSIVQFFDPGARRTWGLLLVLAALVRAVQQVLLVQDPLLAQPVGDASLFLEWARLLAAGKDWTEDVYFQAPLYPYWLSLWLHLGLGEVGLRAVHVAMGACACVVLGRGARHFVGRRSGLGAGYLLALFPPAWHYESLFEKTGLAVFLVSCLVGLAGRQRSRPGTTSALLLGLVFGLLLMTRENFLLLAPLVLAASIPKRRGRRRWSHGLVWLLGLASALAPVTVRNVRAGGDGRPGGANFGPNLYIGNHENADGLYVALVPGRGLPGAEREDAQRLAERELGRPLNAREVSSFWAGRATDWMLAEPWHALKLLAHKFRLLFHQREWMDSTSFEVHRRGSFLLASGSLYGAALLWFLGGLGAWGRRSRRARTLTVWTAVGLASIALFFVFGRFRMSLWPLWMPLAALGISDLLRRPWNGRIPRVALVLVASLGWVHLSVSPADLEQPAVDTYNNLGSVFEGRGEWEAAQRCYRRALEADRGDADANFNLARLLLGEGQVGEAGPLLQLAVDAQPEYLAEAHLMMAQARAAGGDVGGALSIVDQALEAAPDWAPAWSEKGRWLRAAGRPGEAEEAYRKAIAADPAFAPVYNNLGYLLRLQGRELEAFENFERAHELDPEDRAAGFNLTWLLAGAQNAGLRDGQRGLQVLELFRGDGPDPDWFDAAAACWARLGRLDRAIEMAERAEQLSRELGHEPRPALLQRLGGYRRGQAYVRGG